MDRSQNETMHIHIEHKIKYAAIYAKLPNSQISKYAQKHRDYIYKCAGLSEVGVVMSS
jgi:hypothetical protein